MPVPQELNREIGTEIDPEDHLLHVFNDRYLITFLNAQGNHYAEGPTFELGWSFGNR